MKDLQKIKKAFFVGVGGIGISAVARLMLHYGAEVYGSDINQSNITSDLEALGLKFLQGQSADLIPEGVDLVVYTVAINTYEPALLPAIKFKFPSTIIKSYPEMLGVLTAGKRTIAVSGTHGKTTTTAMIAQVLIDAGLDPSVVVGSLLSGHNSNLVIGSSDLFVVEACEYERDFLNLHPDILVITNIEAEHLDYYKDLHDVESAFTELVGQTSSMVVADFTTPNAEQVCAEFSGGMVNYVDYLPNLPHLSVPGEHNRMDAAAAMAVGIALGIPEGQIKDSLAQFAGTWRRLEKKGETSDGVIVYDDYAHHPTEIRASLQGLRELYPTPDHRLIVVFQPHLYSRTKALFNEFTHSFTDADQVIILPIYFAREAKDPTISSEILAQAVCDAGTEASAKDFDGVEEYLLGFKWHKGDVLVTMGAGEAYKVGEKMLKS